MMRSPLIVLSLGAAALGLSACETPIEAPYESGVCFTVEMSEDGKSATFNKLAEGQDRIEKCAARLEETRLRFLRMGGNRREITGAYQGQFIFIDAEGIKISQKIDGTRFMLLARTGDGRLAVPGVIVRDDSGRPVAVAAPPEPVE